MPVFAIVSASQPTQVEEALKNAFPHDYLELPNGSGWLVFAPNATTNDVANKAGISDGSVGSAIVFAIAGYWGRAPTSIWEWISVKMAQR